MSKKMLIDATHPEETRVVVVDGNKVDDFDFESINKRQLAGNIYLAKVTRVEPSLQAAFVEYGGNRHGFLAFAEIHPDYYQIPVADREALLAEEAREEEARRASEEDDEGGRQKRGGRRRGKSKSDSSREISGLEVIDLPEGDRQEATGHDATGDAPRGLEIADTGEVENAASKAQDMADRPREDQSDADSEASAEETTPVEAEAAEADPTLLPDEADEDETETENRTMSEAAGLDDDERVIGGVTGEDDRTVTGNQEEDSVDYSGKNAEASETSDGSGQSAEEGVTAEADASGTPVPAKSEPGGSREEESDSAKLAPEADGAATGEKTDEAEEESTSSDDDEGERKGGRRSRRRRRNRRDRRDADAESDGDNEDNDDEDGDEPEQVGAEDTLEEAARARTRLRRKYKIQDVIKVRQIMLVQVVKEERGNKGAALTTYLSLAGRYCVLMPNTARGGGISRKISNAGDRKRLRDIISGLSVPHGMGLIVRTAGAERTKAEIKRDYEFLLRQWEQIRDLTLKSIAPTLIYEEGSLIKRSIRDIYNKDIDQILVEGEAGYREAKEYMKMLMPSHAKNVQPYSDPIPLFSRYQVESYLNGMFNPTVQLKSGGYIVIGVTEALVAIDVNSGRATKQGSIEETALQTNLEAADEVARQLRLRDLAGLIVIDFIDMDENRNNRAVEKRMKERLKHDRARIQVGRISAFGLMEMSRQRLRPGMLEASTAMCPACHGTGLIRSDESLCLSILRELEEEGLRNRADELVLRAPVEISNYLINTKRHHLSQIEERQNVSISVMADPSLTSPHYEIERSRSQKPRPQRQSDVVTAASVVEDEDLVEDATEVQTEDDDDNRGRKRRGRRGGRRRRDDQAEDDRSQDAAESNDASDDREEKNGEDEDRPKGRRRGRRRGGRNRRGGDKDRQQQDAAPPQEEQATESRAAETATAEGADGGTVTAGPDEPEAANTTGAEGRVESAEPFETTVEAISTEARENAADGTTDQDSPRAETPSSEEKVTEATPASEEEPTGNAATTDVDTKTEVTAEKAEENDQPKRRGWWSFSR